MLDTLAAAATTCVAAPPREDTTRPFWRCSTALRLVPAPVPAAASTPGTLRLRCPPCPWSMRDEVGSTQANAVAMQECYGAPRVGVRRGSAARGASSEHLGACPRINVYSSLIPRQLYGVGVELDTSGVSTSTGVRTSRFTGGMTPCKGVLVAHMAPSMWGYIGNGVHE